MKTKTAVVLSACDAEHIAETLAMCMVELQRRHAKEGPCRVGECPLGVFAHEVAGALLHLGEGNPGDKLQPVLARLVDRAFVRSGSAFGITTTGGDS